MALRGALWFAMIFLLLQVYVWGQANPNPAPDANSLAQNTTTAVKDVFNWITIHINNLVDDIKQNEIYQNVTSALESFARSVKEKGDEVVEKIKNEVD